MLAGRVGPGRALVGAIVAVAGVALVIGALSLINPGHDPKVPVALAPTHTGSAGPTRPGTAATAPAAGTKVTSRPPLRPGAPKTSPPKLRPGSPTGTSVRPAVAPKLPVTVLNNSRLTGLARRAAARYRAGGWPVAVIGNFTGRLRATTVYFAPGQQGSASRFAKQFGVTRVLPRFPGLPGYGLTVVLTRDAV